MPDLVLSHSTTPPTIEELESFDYHVSPTALAQTVFNAFERMPHLPGVLLLDRHKYVGMVSRNQCFASLGRPFGVEVFLKRPIANMYDRLGLRPVPMRSETRIEVAVQIALNRTPEMVYEPVVVEFSDGKMRLLDLHTLLLAQSELMMRANRLIQQQADLGRALSSTLEVRQVLDLVLQHMSELVPYDRAGVMLQKGNALEFAAMRGFPAGTEANELRVGINADDVYGQICRTQQPLRIADVSQRPD